MNPFNQYLDVAVGTAKKAGRFVLDELEKKDFKKDPTQLKKELNRAVNSIIAHDLRGLYAEHGFCTPEGEEGRLTKTNTWLYDPTQWFNANEEFKGMSVQIGWLNEGVPMIGAIYFPQTDELYSAIFLSGAQYRKGTDEPVDLKMKEFHLEEAVLRLDKKERFGKRAKLIRKNIGAKSIVSAEESHSGHICDLTRRKGDIYLSERRVHLAEVCASGLILREAGGEMRSLEDKKIGFLDEVPHVNGLICARKEYFSAKSSTGEKKSDEKENKYEK